MTLSVGSDGFFADSIDLAVHHSLIIFELTVPCCMSVFIAAGFYILAHCILLEFTYALIVYSQML